MFTQRYRTTDLLALAALMTLLASSTGLRRPRLKAHEGYLLRRLTKTGESREVTVLAGGCFWGVQGVFQHIDGVISAVSGYTGGRETRPNTRRPVEGRRGMRNLCRSHSTRIALAMAESSRSFSPWRTIRPSSTDKVPM